MKLADLRTAPEVRNERSLTVCLAPHLVADVQALTEELQNLPLSTNDEDAETGPPRRMGQGRPPREAEIHAEMAALLEQMAEHEGELRLRANMTDGEWRRWCNEHPARPEKTPGHERDQNVTGLFCNADDLIDALGLFAHSWDGDPLAADDWEKVLGPRVGLPDKKQAASAVVGMYEQHIPFSQWRSGLSTNLKRLTASASPATSESPTDNSTDGPPDLFSEGSTETGSK